MAVLREQFLELNGDHSGMLKKVDIEKTLRSWGAVKPEDAEIIFKGVDVDRNSKYIRYHEFLAAALSIEELWESNFRAAFLILSKHSEVIEVSYLRELMGASCSEEEMKAALAEVHIEPDSRISYEQFKNIIYSYRPPKKTTNPVSS